MNPVAHERGKSFKGWAAYVFHDRDSFTRERLAWTGVRNIPTNNPDKAIKWMAWTAKHATWLKKKSGHAPSGRKSSGRVLLPIDLTWHPEEYPTRSEMENAIDSMLAYLGLEQHEVVYGAHNDSQHRHVHVAINLVHPVEGTVADVWDYKRRLQDWAYEYAPESSKRYTPQRVRHVLQRQMKRQKTKYKNPIFLEAANDADSLDQWGARLSKAGYQLCRGKRGVVIMDRTGTVHNPRRHLDRNGKAKLSRWLRGADTVQLPEVGDVLKAHHATTDQAWSVGGKIFSSNKKGLFPKPSV